MTLLLLEGGGGRRASTTPLKLPANAPARAGPRLVTAVRVVEILADQSRPRVEKRLEDLYVDEAALSDAAPSAGI